MAEEQTQAPLQSLQRRGAILLETPAPPDTIPAAQPDWDVFAWNSFIALNWPALEVVPNRARGVPDTSKSFAMAANSDLGVWETFKEKREIFNRLDMPGGLVWQSPIDYGPQRKGGVSVNTRVFHQNSGATTPPNALDETVEVQSQSLERTYPNGTVNPVFKASPPVVTPRVWRGPPSAKNPIVYEVKLNYDYFNYVVANGLNVDNTDTKNGPIAQKAMGAAIRLPVRTSSKMLPQLNPPPPNPFPRNPAVFNYRAADTFSQFRRINYLYHLGYPLPPLPNQGSIQVKAAWLKLGGPDAKPSDFPTWHTAIAVNYITGPDGKPMPSEPTLFGLVGMHIIQRIHTTTPDKINPSQPQGPYANTTGATFVFATWEHASIFNSPTAGQKSPQPTYFYSNFFAGENVEHGLKKGFYPPLEQAAYPVVRQFPVLDNTKKITALVHGLIRQKNPKSVWLNYHLVGTQFQAVNVGPNPEAIVMPPNDPTRIGQPAFLANLAIETNLGLQYFKGQPPFLSVIGNYQGPVSNNNSGAFARNNPNTAFNNKGYNMGGCMGCHGVAQTKGFGFSFVLLDGYLGAVTDTQEHFDQPGANPR
jgi:hypothetical protein